MAALKTNNINVGARVQSAAFFCGHQVSSHKEGKYIVSSEMIFVVNRLCMYKCLSYDFKILTS